MNHGVRDPERLGQTALPEGRRLAWAEWGPEDGIPVLLCPGAATSRWLGFGGDVVGKLGVRLISVDRPGLGASDPAPSRTLDSYAQDILHLAEARGLSPLRVVGYSQGAPFALACAAAGVVIGAAVVSGTDELASPIFEEALEPWLRKMVDQVAEDPVRAEAFFLGFGNADEMWQLVISMSADIDRRVYTDPVFERAFRRALAEAYSKGSAGYARDTLLAMGRWPFDPAGITVPVDLWYGAEDTSKVHSPDFGASLASRIPSAQRHFLADAGGAILWTHAEEILRSLLSRRGPGAPRQAG
jgi:pimeloyl-ACP methyl ester carboxylesterase